MTATELLALTPERLREEASEWSARARSASLALASYRSTNTGPEPEHVRQVEAAGVRASIGAAALELLAGATRKAPKNCRPCSFEVRRDGQSECRLKDRDITEAEWRAETRPDWCPLPVVVIGG